MDEPCGKNETRRWWLGFRFYAKNGPFAYHGPWWTFSEEQSSTWLTIHVVVEADSRDLAKRMVAAAIARPTLEGNIDWLFCEEKDANWSPFDAQHPQRPWMVWDGAAPSTAASVSAALVAPARQPDAQPREDIFGEVAVELAEAGLGLIDEPLARAVVRDGRIHLLLRSASYEADAFLVDAVVPPSLHDDENVVIFVFARSPSSPHGGRGARDIRIAKGGAGHEKKARILPAPLELTADDTIAIEPEGTELIGRIVRREPARAAIETSP